MSLTAYTTMNENIKDIYDALGLGVRASARMNYPLNHALPGRKDLPPSFGEEENCGKGRRVNYQQYYQEAVWTKELKKC